MGNQKKFFLTGLFVAAALLLLIGTMFFLGLADEFAQRIHFVTTFSESVQGLTKGSAVKYKGVPIGQVEKISILPEERIVRVDMSIDPTVFAGLYAPDDESSVKKLKIFFIQARQNGLCCRLDLAGVTGMRYVEMDELLAVSDFISLHTPAIDGKPLINEENIAKMKDGVVFVNTSRGNNVDEAALLAALNSGKVRGAGLDVYAEEPSANAELYSHPNVSCTPHIGAATMEAQKRIGAEIVEIIRNFAG